MINYQSEHDTQAMLPLSHYSSNVETLSIDKGSSTHVADPVEEHSQLLTPDEFIVRQSLSYRCWSKVIDISFGLAGLMLLGLLLPFLAVLIYLDSPGPIFYTQERLGYQKKPFRMYKFRSMHTEAENSGRAVWAGKTDNRVTRIGRLLRATHLDELPQIYNILCGEMSLIGPRPEREVYANELENMQPQYRYRFCVKPGLTGWTQVKFGYGETKHDELVKLRFDLYYIKNQSVKFDIMIILKTVVEMVGCCGR